MDANTISRLLGKSAQDPKVEGALRSLGVGRRPELCFDPSDADGPVVSTQDWVSNLSAGVEFGFQAERAFIETGETQHNVGPMILTEVYFYGERPGVRPYSCPLPFGLSLEDSRSTVRQKLTSFEETRRSYLRDTWEHPDFRFTVSYSEDGERIDFLIFILRWEPPSLCDHVQASLPSVSTMIELLGESLDDNSVRKAFVPLGLEHKLKAKGGQMVADFRNDHGLKLSFYRSRLGQGKLAQAFLLHDLEWFGTKKDGACRWRGSLPFGIGFDDSPEVLLKKVSETPTNQRDEDFVGEVFWEFADYALLVTYSTMENILLSVKMIAVAGR